MKLVKVHSDERRSISVLQNLLKDKKEFSIIEIKPGKALGGCLHENNEHFIVLEGEVEVFIGTMKVNCLAGYKGTFPLRTAHGFYSEKGAIVCEFGITEEEKKNSLKDETMLKEINEINNIE